MLGIYHTPKPVFPTFQFGITLHPLHSQDTHLDWAPFFQSLKFNHQHTSDPFHAFVRPSLRPAASLRKRGMDEVLIPGTLSLSPGSSTSQPYPKSKMAHEFVFYLNIPHKIHLQILIALPSKCILTSPLPTMSTHGHHAISLQTLPFSKTSCLISLFFLVFSPKGVQASVQSNIHLSLLVP